MMQKGTRVKMNKIALENYGEEWQGVVLIVTHAANKYMPAEKFYALGEPEGYHPGYDKSSRSALYDLKRADNGQDLNFSLYGWELTRI